jgi:hypothetical protein
MHTPSKLFHSHSFAYDDDFDPRKDPKQTEARTLTRAMIFIGDEKTEPYFSGPAIASAQIRADAIYSPSAPPTFTFVGEVKSIFFFLELIHPTKNYRMP